VTVGTINAASISSAQRASRIVVASFDRLSATSEDGRLRRGDPVAGRWTNRTAYDGPINVLP
jgi:hypothetical protein